ncbi:MAG: cation diffusion facilitator family transporter, partial [Proteobacteria bacterium]|nr:cation diffusion facilitator family transporter [Pseudomonadota bacterium]
SSVNGIVLMYAMKPKDDNHRFGHGAAEDVVALIQILLIAIASVVMFYYSINLKADAYFFSWISTMMMFLNIVPLCGIIFLQYSSQKQSYSSIMKADILHYSGDFLSTIGVVCAMVLTHYTKILWFDIACGAIVMMAIVYSCWGGAVHAVNNLMARELQDGTREVVEEILKSSNDIISFKELKTRGSGQVKFIQLDIILDENISLKKAHDIAHEIEDLIHEKIQNADVTIHTEPMINCAKHHPL